MLADDTVLFREGVARLLVERGVDVAAQVGDAASLLRAVADHKPDAVVVDIRMPPTHTDEGIRAAEELFDAHGDVGVLVLSQVVEPRYAFRLLERRSTGVGYLLKDRVVDLDMFAAAVRSVASGGAVVDPQVVAHLVVRRRAHDPLATLTTREREVLELMAQGLTNAGIGDSLHLSERTVETHVGTIFRKLELAGDATGHRRVLAVLTYLRS